MAESYWLSFRLHEGDTDKGDYNARFTDLTAEIKAASGNGSNWWFETTSFFIFKSNENIDAIASRIKRAIAEKVDLVVLGMPDFKSGRVIGNCKDQDIYSLVPFMKKA